jgi:lipopolysaccharide export LptBFGC system permease protein LptF
VTFNELVYSFRVPWLKGHGGPFSPKHLNLTELRHAASGESQHEITSLLAYDNPRYYNAQLHRMLAVPFTPFLFAMIGVPLAMLGFVRNRPRGLLLALALLGVYYGLFIFGYDASRDGLLPPWFAVWLPNVLVLVVAIVLLKRTARVPR